MRMFAWVSLLLAGAGCHETTLVINEADRNAPPIAQPQDPQAPGDPGQNPGMTPPTTPLDPVRPPLPVREPGSILHYDGVSLARVPDAPLLPVLGVWRDGQGPVFVNEDGGLMQRQNGRFVVRAQSPVPLRDVSGPPGEGLWTLGTDDRLWSLVGDQFVPLRSDFTQPGLLGLWARSSSELWAVGKGGVAVRWDGVRLEVVPTGTGMTLRAAWSQGPQDVRLVGDQGTILHYVGGAFVQANRITTATLHSVWGATGRDVWAVGDRGTILHWDGSVWSAVPSPTGETLRRVWGSGPGDVWAVGDHGTVLRHDGSSFRLLPHTLAANLRSVGGAPGDVWIVGTPE